MEAVARAICPSDARPYFSAVARMSVVEGLKTLD